MAIPLVERAARARTVGVELAILLGHLLLYPTGISQERAREETPAPDRAPRTPDLTARPPVLLLHGFIDNRSVFALLRRSLARCGWRHVHALNYSPFTLDIRQAARLLARHVEELRARTGQERVDIVAHSLGGLIARYYVQRLGGDSRVRTLITLGTPHSGTNALPWFGPHPLVRQMRPDSDLMAELAMPAAECATRFVAFWSDADQLMSPVSTARIDHPDLNARNVEVHGIGHLTLSVHGAVAADIRRALLDGERPPETADAA
jgi:predicted alpha/beta hydrolase family esterase